MENPKKKGKFYLLWTKLRLSQRYKTGKKNSSVCKSFTVSVSTVSTLWKNRENILKAYQENNIQTKKTRLCAKPDIYKALFKWLRVMRNGNIPFSGPILKSPKNFLHSWATPILNVTTVGFPDLKIVVIFHLVK